MGVGMRHTLNVCNHGDILMVTCALYILYHCGDLELLCEGGGGGGVCVCVCVYLVQAHHHLLLSQKVCVWMSLQ